MELEAAEVALDAAAVAEFELFVAEVEAADALDAAFEAWVGAAVIALIFEAQVFTFAIDPAVVLTFAIEPPVKFTFAIDPP
ncbi:MAG: hypothetical protein KAG66_08490, partial [Methylococcales bacterium]|nr:hypothetical protein [Methylococcales bacterium]